MTRELEKAIQHIKTRADAWAVKEVTEALQSISERLNKALSQEPTIHCNCTDEEIAQSFIEDVEAVKELLPQAESEKV